MKDSFYSPHPKQGTQLLTIVMPARQWLIVHDLRGRVWQLAKVRPPTRPQKWEIFKSKFWLRPGQTPPETRHRALYNRDSQRYDWDLVRNIAMGSVPWYIVHDLAARNNGIEWDQIQSWSSKSSKDFAEARRTERNIIDNYRVYWSEGQGLAAGQSASTNAASLGAYAGIGELPGSAEYKSNRRG